MHNNCRFPVNDLLAWFSSIGSLRIYRFDNVGVFYLGHYVLILNKRIYGYAKVTSLSTGTHIDFGFIL